MKRWFPSLLTIVMVLGAIGPPSLVQVSAPPIVEKLVPAEVFASTGVLLEVQGKNFAAGATVGFQPETGIVVASVTRLDSSRLQAILTVAPEAPTGFRDVVVTNPDQQPGILKAGLMVRSAKELAGLALAPAQARNPVGTAHAVTATLSDAAGKPVAGVSVAFQATGANFAEGKAYTDAAGQATFGYSGAKAGDDTITATAGPLTATSAKQWYAPPVLASLTLAPPTAENPLPGEHRVVATALDGAGKALSGVEVVFQVTGAHQVTATAVTDGRGQAAFSYPGTRAGNDTITATAGKLTASATKQWYAPVAEIIWLTPAQATNPVGTNHKVVATLLDAAGRPVAGVKVFFQVTGANSADGSATTDATGQAAFSYVGPKAGDDKITAMAGKLSASVSKRWTAAPAPGPATVLLTPEKATNLVGSSHKVVATVLDATEKPVSGQKVTFQVAGAHSAGGSGLTDASGQTSFSYKGSKEGEDTITATVGQLTARASKYWTKAAPVAVKLLLAPEKAHNPVGASHKVVATVLDGAERPVSGVRVVFQVTGANSASASSTTDATGQASFTYKGQKEGEDRITAAAGNLAAAASKFWVAAAPTAPAVPKAIWVTQGKAENVVCTHHTLIATVFGSDGKPLAGVQVTFGVTGANPTSGVATTDASGQAVFFYHGQQAGADTITVTAGKLQVTLAKRWVSTPSPPPQVGKVSPATGEPGQDVRLTITGKDFIDGAKVGLSPDAGTLHLGPTRFVNSSQLELKVRLLPGAQPGPRGVVVVNPDGQSGERGQAFMVLAPPSDPPVLTRLEPVSGEQWKTFELSLFGSGFAGDSQVFFRLPAGTDLAGLSPQPDPPGRGGVTVNFVRRVNENELRVEVSVAADAGPGPRDVVVANPDGQFALLPEAFVVLAREQRGVDAEKVKVAPSQPPDGGGLGEPAPTFRWRLQLPLLTRIGLLLRRQRVTYSVTCWELEPGQDPGSAPGNLPHFEATGLSKPSLPYPPAAGGLGAGSDYAWQVSAFVGTQLVARSEVRTFFLLFSRAYRETVERELAAVDETAATSSGDRAQSARRAGEALRGLLGVIDRAGADPRLGRPDQRAAALAILGDCVGQAQAAATSVAGMGAEAGIDDDVVYVRIDDDVVYVRAGGYQPAVQIDDDLAWVQVGERRAAVRARGGRVEIAIGDRVGVVKVDDEPGWVPMNAVWTRRPDQALRDRLGLLHQVSALAAGRGLDSWLLLMARWEGVWEELARLAPEDWQVIQDLGLPFEDTLFLVITLRDLARAAEFADRTDQETYRKRGWRDRWDAMGHFFDAALGKRETWQKLRSGIGPRRLEDLLARVNLEPYLR